MLRTIFLSILGYFALLIGYKDAAEKSLQDAQRAVIEKKEECIKKLELGCDSCKSLKCKQAEDDCKGFMDAAGKWIGKALAPVSDCPKGEEVFQIMAYTERLHPKALFQASGI